jgi:oxalate decarboxylase/phosphoglucose isomerase-like protein (cupin superfamily)
VVASKNPSDPVCLAGPPRIDRFFPRKEERRPYCNQDDMHIKLDQCVAEPSRHGNPKYVLARTRVLPNVTQVGVAIFLDVIETELHSHPTMHEVYYVLEGKAVYTVGEDRSVSRRFLRRSPQE